MDRASIDRSPAGARFRVLTAQLLTIRREKIVPLIKSGFVSAHRQLLGADPRMGGVDVRWQTESGDVLQIVANFAGYELPMPALVDGESLWRSRPDVAGGLASGDMIVRLGRNR
ncbi:MAG: DUF3459 domain-containing protein [Bradyrhizobium sp.]|nr:DUF3459 domain-containing protein [Bradyrhizobium sp.]